MTALAEAAQVEPRGSGCCWCPAQILSTGALVPTSQMPRFADHSLFPELLSANGNCLPWETVQCLPSPPPTPGVKDWLIQSKAVLPYCFKAETTLWRCLCPRAPLWIGPRPPETTFLISPISCPLLLSFLLVGFSWEYTLHKLHASETSCFSFRDINLRWRRRGEKKTSVPSAATATLYVGNRLPQSWTYMIWWFWPLRMRSKLLLSPWASVYPTAAVQSLGTKGMGSKNEIQALCAAVQPGCGQTYKGRSN